MKNKITRILAFTLIIGIVLATSSCKKCKKNKENKEYYDNETATLVFSTQEVDGVFNPFFSTTAADSSVIGMTQLGMLSNDKDGKVVYGDNEAVITKDLEIKTTGSIKNVDQFTNYYFVLKNNVKFSNGTSLTIKDVLFNLYVYLDPVYTGSSTIYSTDIVGLKEYRTQSSDENEQKAFKDQFDNIARNRIEALATASYQIKDDHKDVVLTLELFKQFLKEEYVDLGDDYYKNVLVDLDKALVLFREELESDYMNSIDSYQDVTFKDETGKVYKNLFTTDVEVFLFNEGYITWNKKDAKLISSLTNDPTVLKSWTKEQAISTVYEDMIPNSVGEIVEFWVTATNLFDYLSNQAMTEHFQGKSDREFGNISGIAFANRTQPVTVKGVTYDVPEYNADGSIKSGNEVLSIKIRNVDPKAIWNFSFGVAPMYYYSDQEHIDKFDFVSNFGVEYADQNFMNNVVKNSDKLGVPVGAGPYVASKASGGITNVKTGDFNDKGVIYFERNPYFLMGPAKIKKIAFQVVPSNQMLSTLYTGKTDFVEPNAKPETIQELNSKSKDGIGNKSIQTAGYGYIGINASKVPDMGVRQAIMHSINTQECVNYYKSTAVAIHRPMSKSSWAYPEDATPYYPYIGGEVPADLSVVNPAYAEYVTELGKKKGDKLTNEEQDAFIRRLVENCGYTVGGKGIYEKGSNVLKYTFTIAGEETDHPAHAAMVHASEILNRVNFQINVTTDSNALKKLSTGALTVWAAAWGSTIDPDMYQVYHKDSKATSVLNWGYKAILLNSGNKYSAELALVEELSELIDEARETTDDNQRAEIYEKALNIVMQLAVELPTYQRNDLFAYNANKIDVSTFNSDTSPFKGLTSDIHTISLNTEK